MYLARPLEHWTGGIDPFEVTPARVLVEEHTPVDFADQYFALADRSPGAAVDSYPVRPLEHWTGGIEMNCS